MFLKCGSQTGIYFPGCKSQTLSYSKLPCGSGEKKWDKLVNTREQILQFKTVKEHGSFLFIYVLDPSYCLELDSYLINACLWEHKEAWFKAYRTGADYMLVDTLLSESIKYFSRGWISNHLLVMLLTTFIYKLGSWNKSPQTLRLNFQCFFSKMCLNSESKILCIFQHA